MTGTTEELSRDEIVQLLAIVDRARTQAIEAGDLDTADALLDFCRKLTGIRRRMTMELVETLLIRTNARGLAQGLQAAVDELKEEMAENRRRAGASEEARDRLNDMKSALEGILDRLR